MVVQRRPVPVAIQSLCFALSLSVLLSPPAPANAQALTPVAVWNICATRDLLHPWHLAFDGAGHVLVTDPSTRSVDVFGLDGVCVASWGYAEDPYDWFPQGLAMSPDGTVYVTTPLTNGPPVRVIYRFTPMGTFLGTMGEVGEGPGQLQSPEDIAFDREGNAYVADRNRRMILVYSPSGEFLREWGGMGSAPGQFSMPRGIVVSRDGEVFVTDDVTHRVQVFTTTGTFLRQWGSPGSAPGQFQGPYGIDLDAAGRVVVADAANHRIQVFTEAGEFLTTWGSGGTGPGQFDKPRGVSVGPDGRTYVADSWNARLQVFDASPVPVEKRSWGALKVRYR